ncbi:Arginine transport ATP-binding protein ArtM [Rhodobacteraceae bacterium THAF1]|uniref:ATP-binding cassette domain-containing protein n=1 Tax=Palleronia sp. THAF1 TaxID=2587842 RepID=UPI000F3D3C97|nr:ATP-binding cassette domain-containing protein [Palleronia sp. THAF1]QFU07950.1 Arginine transport ATP-binding protein ArtM [Palleronia sp. THAF1]VDC27801.1 Arginine transport ATP-binding protein ArtM [Rhodobacteraceae bacterium THAF1]
MPVDSVLPLIVRDLRLERDGTSLLNGIDATIDAPGITVVMGPNGAGKSLFLKCLHGLQVPSSGTVTWPGPPPRQAMVFQHPVLLRRSVAANLDFVTRDRGKRDTLLDRVGLSDRARQPARALSGGEQQRLAFARALATDPQVLFLDEPTASLDPSSTAGIETLVQGAARAGTKVIFVTHDTGQARRLADDVLFLHQGRLTEHSHAADFFTQPESSPAAAFLAGDLPL